MPKVSELILLELNKAERVAISGTNTFRDISGKKQTVPINNIAKRRDILMGQHGGGNRDVMKRMAERIQRRGTLEYKTHKYLNAGGHRLRNFGKRLLDNALYSTGFDTATSLISHGTINAVPGARLAARGAIGAGSIIAGRKLNEKHEPIVRQGIVDAKTHRFVKQFDPITLHQSEVKKAKVDKYVPPKTSKVSTVSASPNTSITTHGEKLTDFSSDLKRTRHDTPGLRRFKRSGKSVNNLVTSTLHKTGETVDKHPLTKSINKTVGSIYGTYDKLQTDLAKRADLPSDHPDALNNLSDAKRYVQDQYHELKTKAPHLVSNTKEVGHNLTDLGAKLGRRMLPYYHR